MYECDIKRMEEKITAFGGFGDTGHGGITRFSLSPAAIQARNEIKLRMTRLGLDFKTDDLGDIYCTLPGTEPDAKVIMSGSHCDSVRQGGNYDGILGVLTAMEVIETIVTQKIPHRHPIQLVVWTNEEGALYEPGLLDVSVLEAALMGAVVAAVSPAVIVPKMIKLMEEGYGTKKGIPQLILAGASVDDVFVIVLFTAFLGLAQGERLSVMSFVGIPVAVGLGSGIGFFIGVVLAVFFKKVHMRDTVKVLIFLCVSFLLVTAEDAIKTPLTFSALIAIMFIGIALQMRREVVAKRLSVKFNKLWVGAEVLLFVLVGATVDIRYAMAAGAAAVVLIFGVLAFRMLGVLLCLLHTNLNYKEKLFCMFAYIPKATVQAAIGGIPLAAGLGCGNMVLTVAVVAILITAPLGAFLIEGTYERLLRRQVDL